MRRGGPYPQGRLRQLPGLRLFEMRLRERLAGVAMVRLGGVGAVGRGLNVAYLSDVFPGFSPVGHQGVAYGMCAELFADPATGAGVGIMTNGVSLERSTPPLMRVGFDLLSLGFAALRNA